MKKFGLAMTAMLLAVSMTACASNPSDSGEQKLRIGIIQPAEHAALDSAREGFVDALADHGYVDGETMQSKGVAKVEDLNELCARADYISIHTPLTDATKGIIGKEQFACMKPGTYVINCARGGVVDEAAAREALASGKLAGLSVDVLANELAGKGLGDNAGLSSDLFGMEHFTVSPHIGGSTHEAYDGIGVFIVEKAAEFYGLSK